MVGFGGCSTRLLSESLSRFSTLREFEFSCCQLSDDDVETLLQALAGHSRLTKIHLCDNEVGARGMAALAALLSKPDSSLADLDLSLCKVDNEGALILAAALVGNRRLRKLDISQNADITVTGWQALLTQLLDPQLPLEKLEYHC